VGKVSFGASLYNFYQKLSGSHYQNKASILEFFILKQGNEVTVLIF